MPDDSSAPRKFLDLPPHTRAFMSKLGEDDLKTLRRVIRVFDMVQGWCRVNRWIFFGLLGALIYFAHATDAFKGLFSSK